MEFTRCPIRAPPSSAKLPFLFPEKTTIIEIYRRYAVLAGSDVVFLARLGLAAAFPRCHFVGCAVPKQAAAVLAKGAANETAEKEKREEELNITVSHAHRELWKECESYLVSKKQQQQRPRPHQMQWRACIMGKYTKTILSWQRDNDWIMHPSCSSLLELVSSEYPNIYICSDEMTWWRSSLSICSLRFSQVRSSRTTIIERVTRKECLITYASSFSVSLS